jgi:thioredoxin 1
MRHLSLFAILVAVIQFSCSSSPDAERKIVQGGVLSALDFATALQQAGPATILDVRTPSEFAGGHIVGGENADISSGAFEKRVSELDVSKPVFVYCLSGGRSASAAQYLKGRGFKRVYDLQGGIMQWRAAKLPLEQGGGGAKGAEMSQQAYEELIKSDQLVLVDFYAEWCQPCKRMAPYLAEISKEMADKVKVVRIDVEANRALSEKIGVTMLPTLLLYKGGKVSWKQEGFIEKEAVVKQIASR